MELNIYDIIKRPLITTKSVDLYKKYGQYTFEVHKNATKLTVGDAIEKLWSVKVAKVRIINLPGKVKFFGRRPFQSSGVKKAVVTLQKGYKIEIPGMFETMTAAETSVEKSQAAGD
jgi:large subunit ribosomal protein L23